MRRNQNTVFKDSDTVDKKIQDVLNWIRRRLNESVAEDSGELSPLIIAIFGKESSSREALKVLMEENSLRACNIPSGCTNISVRVWNERVFRKHDSLLPQSKPNRSETGHGIFVKVALPYSRWSPHKRCDVRRLDREFRALNCLRAVCPGATARPLLCSFDELENDGSKYLALECLPDIYENYSEQFKNGNVDIEPARLLGVIFAKFHCEAPFLFGGKSRIKDEITLDYLSSAHYRKLAADIEKARKSSDGKIGAKVSKFWNSNHEILRACSRHLQNFIDPPQETATFAHLDSHVLNVLVRSEREGDQFEDTLQVLTFNRHSSQENVPLVKLCDMEFSNWGPAGADLGLFIGSAFFYAMMHSCTTLEHNSAALTIPCLWKSYRDNYLKVATAGHRSENSVVHSLFKIVHEALGWAGAWMIRFTMPNVFYSYTISDAMYSIPLCLQEVFKNLKSKCGDFDGFEILREESNKLAARALLMGFGDESHLKVTSSVPGTFTIDDCNLVMERFVDDLTITMSKLQAMIQQARKSPTEQLKK